MGGKRTLDFLLQAGGLFSAEQPFLLGPAVHVANRAILRPAIVVDEANLSVAFTSNGLS